MSKRSIGLVLVLSMVMVMAFAGVAMAAQIKVNANGSDTKGAYLPTPKQFSTTDSTYAYPNGIYLPNADAPADYRIHSNYAKNTDACAACHATHTAVGSSLLQWGNVYEACMACHDGTVSTTYNVKGGQIGDNVGVRTFGGMFGDGTDTASGSNHNATGAVDISAAPGGTTTANSDEVDPTKGNAAAAWSVEFGCQSCHTPHGAGANARILHPNPNGQSFEKFNNGTTQDVVGAIYNADPAKFTFADADNNKYFILKGYPYATLTAVYDDGGLIPSSEYTINNKGGDFSVVEFSPAPTGQVKAWFVPALQVKMDVQNYLEATEDVTHLSGMNSYCGACHTDYNTADDMAGFVDGAYNGSGSKLTGEYTEAYRHQVGMNVATFASAIEAAIGTTGRMPFEQNKMTCETCHFAHGATKELWNDVQGPDYDADEISGSSALKRLPNMGTCEACHQKGEGNEGYSNPKLSSTANVLAAQTGATFVGSTKCAECHANHKSGWETTSHSQMLRPAIDANLMPTRAEYDAWLADNGAAADFVINDGLSTPADITNAVYVIGSKRKQRFIFDIDPDPSVVKYRFANYEYYKAGSGSNGVWNAYGNSKDYEDFCMNCHTTGLKVNTTAADGILDGTFESVSELGVSCEACHGAGSIHASAPSTVNIVNPAKLSYSKSTDVCGSCHNRGWNKTFTGATGHAAEAGLVAVPAVADSTQREDFPNFKPGMDFGPLASLYFAPNGFDGAQMKSMQNGGYATGHHQQYMEFKDSSKHYDVVNMTCSSCHSSHGKNSAGSQLKLSAGQTCGQCHGNTYDITTYMPLVAKQAGNNGKLPSHTFVVPGQTDATWVLDGDK